MKTLVPAMGVLLSLGTPAVAVPDAAPRAAAAPTVPDFAHFQVILDRMPFGHPLPPPPPADQSESPAKALAEKNLVNLP